MVAKKQIFVLQKKSRDWNKIWKQIILFRNGGQNKFFDIVQ